MITFLLFTFQHRVHLVFVHQKVMVGEVGQVDENGVIDDGDDI